MVQAKLHENHPSRDDPRTVRLFNAAAMGDADQVRALLEQAPGLVRAESRGQWGDRTPLHVAAQQGHLAVAEALLQYGADIHARDEGDNATPLHWAAESGHAGIASLLLDHGADPNATDDMHERGPLGWAVALHDYRPVLAELLIARGARIDIFAAIALDREDTVRALVAADPNVLRAGMSLCEDYRNPLHFTVTKDRPAMLELLLELGADPAEQTPSGRTALCLAIEHDKPGLAEKLRARGVGVDLLAAIAMGDEALLDAHLAQPMESPWRDQALLAAAQHGRTEAVRRLLARGADLRSIGRGSWLRGTSALILAANGNHTEAARLLLENGADVAFQDEYPGTTALHFACWHGNRELAGLLLDRGADLTVKDKLFGADPVGWAIENHKSELVDYLVERGAIIDISRAAYLGKIHLVRSLLDADPGSVDFRGGYGTALHQAALHGYTEIVELLLNRGADPAILNRHGDSVLMAVHKAQKGLMGPTNLITHAAIEEMLVRHGASE